MIFYMEEDIKYHIKRGKYQLTIEYIYEQNKTKILFIPKSNNFPLMRLEAELPGQISEENTLVLLRRLRRHRNIQVHLHIPAITFIHENFSILLKLNKEEDTINEIKKVDTTLNYGLKHWRGTLQQLQVEAVLNPYEEQIQIKVLQRKTVRAAQASISLASLPKKEISDEAEQAQDPLEKVFQFITSASGICVCWEQRLFILNHNLIKQVPLINQIVLPSVQNAQTALSEKEQIFRHIFLVEVITHMIITQFGRSKQKHVKNRDGHISSEYEDEELEELRFWGHRFSEFRDHPIKYIKKKRKHAKTILISDGELEYSESEQKLDPKNKITKLKKMGKKLQSMSGINNFTFISGRDKSRINKKRYILHSMTQQTDKTQALINFVQLVFQSYPCQSLIERKGESNAKRQSKMRHFLKQFQVKRRAIACFEEYTRQSFFHQILNKGLRIFNSSFEMAYLRLPFSHLFWSIKLAYHRHKKAIFGIKKEKSNKRTILLYRGFYLTTEEIQTLKKKVGGYVQMEGFHSTTLNSDMIGGFTGNGKMIIEVPVANLRGIFDNGFAHLSQYSEHPMEREVLINAFNLFKILYLKQEIDESGIAIYTVRLQYGGIKEIEDKVKKSDNLLASQYEWIIQYQQQEKVKKKLEKNKKEMSEEQYQKLVDRLPDWEARIMRRKKKIKEWAREEYEQAEKKLSQWDLELLRNTKHQQQQISNLHNYVQQLKVVEDYSRLQICVQRRLKQIELEKVVTGGRNLCLIHKEILHRTILFQYTEVKNKIAELSQARNKYLRENIKKLLNLYVTTNIQTKKRNLIDIFFHSQSLLNQKNSDDKKLKQKLNKYKAYNEYRERNERSKNRLKKQSEEQNLMKEEQEEQEKKSPEQKQKQQRQKQILQLKETLKQQKRETGGRQTTQYLTDLYSLIICLKFANDRKDMRKVAKQYLYIVKLEPELQNYMQTFSVFLVLLEELQKNKRKKQFQCLCWELVENYKSQWEAICLYMRVALKWQCWRVGNKMVLKLQKTQEPIFLLRQLLKGYVMLLMSGSSQTYIGEYLSWAKQKVQMKEYLDKNDGLVKKHFEYIRQYHKEYEKSKKGIFESRKKEYKDGKFIQYVYQQIYGTIIYSPLKHWRKSQAQVRPWQHPCHLLYNNLHYSTKSIEYYLAQGQLNMVILFFKHFLRLRQEKLRENDAKKYSRRLRTLCSLHLNNWEMKSVPPLLSMNNL